MLYWLEVLQNTTPSSDREINIVDIDFCLSTFVYEYVPVGIWCKNDVVSTSIRRNHVAWTLKGNRLNVRAHTF